MEKQKKGVRLEHISKIYNDPKTGKEFYAVQDTTLDIEPGTFVTLLGPSGCGKTTTLRMIAGFESPDEGEIYLGDEAINSLTPNKRDTAMVFQSYALLPHYNVFDNVAYGLKIRKVPKEEIRERVLNILKLVEMDGMESRMTNQLSGGQQQRVALARALVIEPSVLLFDEPLSNLDAKLRVTMRTEIRKIQQKVGITAIYVTHDQSEAMSISDKIIIMSKGKVEQIGTPREIYYHPKSRFVADFIGEANFLKAKVKSVNGEKAVIDVIGEEIEVNNYGEKVAGEEASLVLRPEAVVLSEKGLLEGTVTLSTFMGSYQYYQVMVGDMEIQITDYNPVNRRIYEVGEKAYLDMCSRSAFTKIIGKWSGANIADKEKFVQNTFDHMNERCRLMLWSEELDLELTGHHVAKKAAIKCPVNVEIYDPSGSLICTIQDGVESDVTMQQGRFVCRYEPLTGDYTKVLYFFDDGDYQLKMIGTDAGEVSMGLASMASGTEMTEWQAHGIPVLKGGMIQLNIADGTYQADGNADGIFEMAGTLDERKTSAALAGLVLSRDELTLQTGQTAALGVSASPAGTMLPHVWWESSDEAVASVSDGAVTALAKGTAVITVHSEDLTAQCVVNVTGQEHSGETTDPTPGPTPGPTPEPDPAQKPDPIPAHQSKSDDSNDDDTAAARTGGMQLMNSAYLGEGSWSFDPASGSWSCKKPDGSLLKSCWAFLNGRWYLFDPAGKMLVNWVLVQGTWYCLGQDGAMLTGWVKTGEKWYYLGEDGAMLTGRRLIDGVWYDLDGE